MTEPVATPPPVTHPATPAPTPTPVADQKVVALPLDAFNARLKEESEAGAKRLLKSLGYEKPEELQAVLKVAKDKADAELSETQRLQKRVAELEPVVKDADAWKSLATTVVESQFSSLPDNVKTAIDDVAKGDPKKRVEMMDVMRKAGVLAAPPTGTPAPAGAPPHPALANTAPAGAPPSPATTKTKFQEWQELEKGNPTHAAIFYDSNRFAIEKSRPADQ